MNQFRTYDLAVKFYKEAKNLKLPSPMKDQFQRALLSIALNLSEGSSKPTRKDRARFYYIALGSFREVETILKLSDQTELFTQMNTLGSHLVQLCRKT